MKKTESKSGGKAGKGKKTKEWGKKTPKPPYIPKPKPKKVAGALIESPELQQIIFDIYNENPRGSFDPRHVITMTGIRNNADSVQSAMDKLVEAKVLIIGSNGRYKLSSQAVRDTEGKQRNYTGVVDMTMNGAAFVLIDGRRDDTYISERNLRGALDGDTVQIAMYPKRGEGRRMEGEVVEILQRANDHFIGVISVSRQHAFLTPDKVNMPVDIFVPLDQLGGAKNGQKVVVKIAQWHDSKHKNPVGTVTLVLGDPNSSDVAMQSILLNAGFNLLFPDAVIAESELLTADISAEELAARKDFRAITTFTIDPEDAKDFDDALSYRLLPNGNIEVGVHIADVSHYVRPSSAMDEEAAERTTSVYLVDRVLPMLPEKISNELCSLRPHEDKRTFSAVFEFDAKFNIVDRWFGKTYIHSNRRFSYEEAQAVLETGEGDFVAELQSLNAIAHHLRKLKYANGAISFEAPEVRFKLDETGKPLELYLKTRKDAHLLIEDFMLLANKSVAEYIDDLQRGQSEIPFVYRVHDTPNLEKLADFALYAKTLGVTMKIDTPKQIAASFNRLTEAAETDDAIKTLLPLAIRTMSKAEYSTENIGHYGLGFAHYSHFTSPIRRYADVLAHRILYKNIVKPIFRANKATLVANCQHISLMERKAMDAERQSIKYKQAEYLADQIGVTFEGIISGMNDRALFVELTANFCEGRVSFDNKATNFVLENKYSARNVHSGELLRIGSKVQVRIMEVDVRQRQIDMELV